MSVSRQMTSTKRVCRLTPMGRARALTPPLGQWPAAWQLHTLMVSVLVLERAGDPPSITTTGRRYWVRSRRLKELLRAMMLAVLSAESQERQVTSDPEGGSWISLSPGRNWVQV